METTPPNIKKWYKTKKGILLIIVFFPIFFYYFLYKLSRVIWRKNWSMPKRAGAIAGLWGVVIALGANSTYGQTASLGTTTQVEQQAQAVPSPANIPILNNSAPTNSPAPTAIVNPTAVYNPPTATPKPYVLPTATQIPYTPPVQNNVAPVANTGSSGGGSSYTGGDKDCGDFATHAEAQAFFISQGGPSSDPHRLDADNDGSACES